MRDAEAVSAEPASLTRLLKSHQTIFAFFNFFQHLATSIARRRSRFSEAFDYALLFQAPSTFEDFFLNPPADQSPETSPPAHRIAAISVEP
ncbi:hypothetical protein, partial [Planktothrix mougeotii]|uniref:hypothetical protein n=1 Tax=Planktothrix mougeotii TaxID=54306 RepID=UPI001D13E02E